MQLSIVMFNCQIWIDICGMKVAGSIGGSQRGRVSADGSAVNADTGISSGRSSTKWVRTSRQSSIGSRMGVVSNYSLFDPTIALTQQMFYGHIFSSKYHINLQSHCSLLCLLEEVSDFSGIDILFCSFDPPHYGSLLQRCKNSSFTPEQARQVLNVQWLQWPSSPLEWVVVQKLNTEQVDHSSLLGGKVYIEVF